MAEDKVRFVPVPYDAIEIVGDDAWIAALDIYKRAHSLRWASFSVTERSLATKWKLSIRRVWAILDDLAAAGMIEMVKGSKRRPTRIRVICPTNENTGYHKSKDQDIITESVEPKESDNPILMAEHNSFDAATASNETETKLDGEVAAAPQAAPTPATRKARKHHDRNAPTQPESDAISSVWAIYREYHRRADLAPTGPDLDRLLVTLRQREQANHNGASEACRANPLRAAALQLSLILRWAHESQDAYYLQGLNADGSKAPAKYLTISSILKLSSLGANLDRAREWQDAGRPRNPHLLPMEPPTDASEAEA